MLRFVLASSLVATGAVLPGGVNGAPDTRVQFVPTMVPVMLLPELSATVVPLVSLKLQRPFRPGADRDLRAAGPG